MPLGSRQRERLRLRGVLQGVGFRPHAFRLAQRFGLAGSVRNDGEGVTLEIEGEAGALAAFRGALAAELPPLARLDALHAASLVPTGDSVFTIEDSARGAAADCAIPADTAVCDACLAELFDPADRRYLHPFIACCHCGPRYSMSLRLPYDRSATTMAPFALCDACAADYRDPTNRRFHAEPIACHDCGPTLSAAIGDAAAALQCGGVVALKGYGGFQLLCDARSDAAVARLRRLKGRERKPLAVMVLNGASAAALASLPEPARHCLESPARPVLLLDPGPGAAALSPLLAPGLRTLGLLLPATPLHYLLFHALLGRPAGSAWLRRRSAPALVATSANRSGDPLLCDDGAVAAEFAGLVDCLVGHDRAISARVDDSVCRSRAASITVLRRARGFVPATLPLRDQGPVTLATGGHLKNTLALLRAGDAQLSPHVGDLDSPATRRFHDACAERLLAVLHGARPQLLACDWHPDYASTRSAEALRDRLGAPLVRVQHHHAHAASVLAEHGEDGPALALILDGHGLGRDGQAWGGELLRVEGAACDRLGHLAALPAPGGERAAREPWRLALGALLTLGLPPRLDERFAGEPLAPALAALGVTPETPRTTAAGRLFDTAAGLLGVCLRQAYEGEAAMRLEALAGDGALLENGYRLTANGNLDLWPLLAALAGERDPRRGAGLFHGTFVAGLAAWVARAAASRGERVVVLGGGCFVNRRLAAELPAALTSRGLRVLLPRRLPPGDGGLCLGQGWLARRAWRAGLVGDRGLWLCA